MNSDNMFGTVISPYISETFKSMTYGGYFSTYQEEAWFYGL